MRGRRMRNTTASTAAGTPLAPPEIFAHITATRSCGVTGNCADREGAKAQQNQEAERQADIEGEAALHAGSNSAVSCAWVRSM